MMDQLPVSDRVGAEYFLYLSNFNLIPIITWNFDGTVTSANDAYLHLIGYSRDDFNHGKINWEKLTPDKYKHLDDHCMKELGKHHIATPYEKEYIKKDGSRVKIRLYNAISKEEHDKGVAAIIPV